MIENLMKRVGKNLRIASNVEISNPDHIEIGDNVVIGSQTIIIGYHHAEGGVVIGDRTWIGPMCYMHGAGGIYIGNDVGIGPGVKILTSSHTGEDTEIPVKNTPLKFDAVIISDGSDIGMGAIILPGITVGKGAIVGAGAVITKNVPPFTTVAGNPARIISTR